MYADAANVDQIIAYLCDGDDHMTIANSILTPAIIHGGADNDHLVAGGGPTVLLGNSGDDMLVGGKGSNVLIGGTGRDRLTGGNSDDVLIGGSTNIDADDDALLAVAIAWKNVNVSYEIRKAAIAAMFVETDDGVQDKLTGSAGRDLFYDGLGDVLTDRKPTEDVL